jgi:hypothetical protein
MGGSAVRGSGRRHLAVLAPVALALIALVAIAGCTSTAGGSSRAAPRTPAGGTTAAGPRDADQAPPLRYPTEDATSQQAALDAATAAITAFARPDATRDAWWAGLSPLLSPAATTAYVGTDPAEVPARVVIGPAEMAPGPSRSPFLATVFVPTDAGPYAVLLVRADDSARWLAERISPAEPAASPTATATATATGTGP